MDSGCQGYEGDTQLCVLAGEGALPPSDLFCLDEEKLAQRLNIKRVSSKRFMSLTSHFGSFVTNSLYHLVPLS